MIDQIMSFLGYEKKSDPKIARNPRELDRMITAMYGGGTSSGISVTPSSAMKSAIVYACVRVLSESVAQLPLIIYRRNGKARERAVEHPLYPVLHDQPNENQTSFEFREMMTAHMCLRGNAYAFVNRLSDGRIAELVPFHPDRVNVNVSPDGTMSYEVTQDNGGRDTFPREKIFHLKGLSLNGYVGVSPITYARETIGFNLAAERHGAQIFSNAARPGGVLMYKEELDEESRKNLLEGWQSAYSGENALKTALLEYGIEWKPMSMSSVDAQWIESRRFSLQDVARLFRMQLHKVQEMSQATYSNIEQQNIEFVVDTLLPWLRRWEQAISRDLFSREERKTFYVEFLVDALLRGDAKSRNEAYNIMRNAGVINANEWREKENFNPRTDLGGDYYWKPMNMDESGVETAGEAGGGPGKGRKQFTSVYVKSLTPLRRRSVDERRRLRNIYFPKFKGAAENLVKLETSSIRKALDSATGRDPAALEAWLTTFYESLPQAARSEFLGLLLTYAEEVQRIVSPEVGIQPGMTPEMERFVGDYLHSFALRYAGSSQGQLKELIREAEPEQMVEAVSARLDEWEEGRPSKVARREVVEAESAVTKKVYILGGVTMLVWVAHGENCPFCQRLDGMTVGITGNFVEDGDQIPGGGTTMNVRGAKSHPPLHRGCDCTISIGF